MSVVFLCVIVVVGYVWRTWKNPPREVQQKTREEVLQDLTAPNRGEPVSPLVRKDLTAPAGNNTRPEISSSTLRSLTAPKPAPRPVGSGY